MESFVQISEGEEYANSFKAELRWLNCRQHCFRFQGPCEGRPDLSNANPHSLVLCGCHFPLLCWPWPPSASLGCFIPCAIFSSSDFAPSAISPGSASLFCLGSVTSQVILQHDTCLLPLGSRTSSFHVGVSQPCGQDWTLRVGLNGIPN